VPVEEGGERLTHARHAIGGTTLRAVDYARVVPSEDQTYASAGVSLATAEAVVDRLRSAVESTLTPAVAGSFGAFAGLFEIDEHRLLAASTDSVGSKLVLARRAGKLRWCGADLAAHGINDVSTTGAEPLFFLDYVAANTIDPEQVAELVEGAADVCRAAGCAILGGETAELPGIYRDEEIDFCGTVVGVVGRDSLVDGLRAEPGDVVVGFPSAGIHANGFSLVRRIVGDDPFDADLLLPPTRCYLDDVRALRARADVRALAHVTGGGIAGNLARVLPDGVGAVVDPGAWERPRVFAWLAEHGVAEDELRRVFNLGIGYCAVVPPADVHAADLVIGRLEAGVDGVEWGGA
jgi:phosphoribosylformylglycinamidine cyclo-ligase